MLAALKPLISALLLPPGGPLLLAAVAMVGARRWPRLRFVAALAVATAWFTSSLGSAVWFNDAVLGAPTPKPELLIESVAAQSPTPQAVVILGGGASGQAHEWPQNHQLQPRALARLHYGLALARHWQLPALYSGGLGWAADASQRQSEAEIAQSIAATWGQALRWTESGSRDTRENAQRSAALLRTQGVQRIALVTHAWHMPRAQGEFEAAGLTVLPAPMGAIQANQPRMLLYLPSTDGVYAWWAVLHESLGLLAARARLLP